MTQTTDSELVLSAEKMKRVEFCAANIWEETEFYFCLSPTELPLEYIALNPNQN